MQRPIRVIPIRKFIIYIRIYLEHIYNDKKKSEMVFVLEVPKWGLMVDDPSINARKVGNPTE